MQAINRPFNQLINGNTQFFIPVFQRDFTWGEDQCRRFWQDIQQPNNSGNSSYSHFLGSFVYVDSRDTSAGFTRWMVIDGQQRLTTLTILCVALRDVLLESGVNGSGNGPTPEQVDAFFLKNQFETGDRQRKLVLRRNDDATLASLIEHRELPQDPSERILDAYALFKQLLVDSQPDVAYNGIMSLVVVDVRLDPNTDNPQLVFESLNSTGVDLSQADHIRNFVLMSLSESDQSQMYDQYWRQIEDLFRDAGSVLDTFFRDFIALKTGATVPIRNDQIYQMFKYWFGDIPSETEDIQSVLADLLRYARYYSSFKIGRNINGAIASNLGNVRRLADAPAMLIMKLFALHRESQTLSESDLIEGISLIESYLLRRAICRLQTRGYWPIFASLAKGLPPDGTIQDFKVGLSRLPESYRFPSDEEFSESLTVDNIYRLQVCRPLLERLENADNNEPTDTSSYSIEHIMPQNKNLSSAWIDMLGTNWEDIHARYLHSLGNLTLTGYNSAYGDRSFEEKKTIQGGFNDSSVRLNRYVRDQVKWSQEEIVDREKQLVARAISIFKQPNVDVSLIKQSQIQDLRILAEQTNPNNIVMSEKAKHLFESLRSAVIALQQEGELIEIAGPRTITYYDPDFFLEIIPRQHRLDLLLSIDFADIDDPFTLAEDMETRSFLLHATQHGGVVLYMNEPHELNQMIPLIRQSLNAARSN